LEVAAERLKERIYAAITMIAVVVGLSATHGVGVRGAALTVATTALGLWLATLVADQQAHRVLHERLATGQDLRRLLHVSSPLLLSAVGPLVMVAAAALGVMSLHTGLLTAAAVDVGALFTWGCLSGIRMGGGVLAGVLAGAIDALIGVAVALVKLTAGH
jgi:hypothetical protein